MLVAFSVAPSGRPSDATLREGQPRDDQTRDDASVHDAVAAAVSVVRASGLPHRTDSMFTTIEGEWDECMAVVKQCVDAVQPFGSRVALVLKADIRPGYTGELTGKLERLEQAIADRG
ncbi:thiamine-binding protein [Aestuariimicrobium kwangyangense]|uniref:thiamine-binding protein n=1 Tax=Aestuariimicrobium kwangyangense TaxID=396389 RepID=UPI0003B63763|nr:thiamine-binding protein [Aestuariimicrobium kwangyangense]